MPNPVDKTQQLADYIKRNLSKGYHKESLQQALINQGYSKISVFNAIEIAEQQLAKEKLQITHTIHIQKTIPENSDDKDNSENSSSYKPKDNLFEKFLDLFR